MFENQSLVEYYHGFLSDSFDVKQHACQLLQGAIVSEQLAKLSEGNSAGFNFCCYFLIIISIISQDYHYLIRKSIARFLNIMKTCCNRQEE